MKLQPLVQIILSGEKGIYLFTAKLLYIFRAFFAPYVVGPCHHGMARPQVADRGTASDKEGSCE